MNHLFIALVALSLSIAVPVGAAAADGATTHAAAMDCCNTTCPVCDMAVDKAVNPEPFKPSESAKKKHAGIETAHVGFCSDKCKMAYQKEPAKYEDKITPQWQQWKNKPVKGG